MMIIIVKVICESIVIMICHELTAGDTFTLSLFFNELRELLLNFLSILDILQFEAFHGLI